MKESILLMAVLLLGAATGYGQEKKTNIDYDLSAETAVGTGRHTAYQLVTNRHHVLSTRPNTAYLRGAVTADHALGNDFMLSGAIDMVASVHADHKAYLQQCYGNISWRKFFLEVGSREQRQVLRNERLSIGHFAKGTNAKPIPQVHIGTSDFWTVPYTKGWLQIHFDGGYGKLMDNSYRKEAFRKAPNVNPGYTTGAYYHQKHFYFRSNPEKVVFITAGIEHVALFGGTNYAYTGAWGEGQDMAAKSKPANLKAFWKVILPVGDKNYVENNAMEDWVYGNHLGSITYQIGWNITKQHQVQAYLDVPFEDGSGMRKGNGWDGLWGMEYTNKAPGRQWIRGAVVEYFQSTNQSGPLHYDGGDYPEPIRSQITAKVTGNDNYYNHMFYDSYTHHGMTPGIALITSPIYNKDGRTQFRDNRVKAWHVAVEGELTDRLSYLVKGSYREGWGTYQQPLVEKHHSFDAMVQGNYQWNNWMFSGAYAFDKGNIYGDCSTFNIKIGYHGKIL